MLSDETRSAMWADLLTTQYDLETATRKLTRRARIYVAAGLPLEDALSALSWSRATWYRRLAEAGATDLAAPTGGLSGDAGASAVPAPGLE